MTAMANDDSILLVSTAASWYAPARAPRAFAKAGFEVTLLTPRNALAEHTRHLSRIAYLPESVTSLQWVHAFAGIVKAVAPAHVIPCDEMSFRLLSMLVVSPPSELRPELRAELADLVRGSLGDPAHYRESADRTRVPAAAERAGVRVPPYVVAATLDDAERFAASHGYPLAVKRAHSGAGDGTRIVSNHGSLVSAIAALSAPDPGDLEPDVARRVMVQKVIEGRIWYQNVVAWQGRMLAGYAGDCLQPGRADATAPATVLRFRDAPDLGECARLLAAAFGISGIFTCEYVIDDAAGNPYLVEISRRIGPAAHYGAVLGVDLCAALRAAARGVPPPGRSAPEPGQERTFVVFPGEWLRDPASQWLRRHPVDVPWDDPQLIEAMLALRHRAARG